MPPRKPGLSKVIDDAGSGYASPAGTGHGARQRRMKARRGKPVDIMYALSKMVGKLPHVQIAMDRWAVETDKMAYAVPYAGAVRDVIDTNIRDGKNPSGRKSKKLDKEYVKYQREGSGPRGINTGQTIATLRVEVVSDGVGSQTATVVMDQPHSPGQFKRVFGGARFTYDMDSPVMLAALEELTNVLIVEDHPENWLKIEDVKGDG
jgi:hypothetical protein